MGMLEDVPADELAGDAGANGAEGSTGTATAHEATANDGDEAGEVLDSGPAEPPAPGPVVRREPVVLGAPAPRRMDEPVASTDWSTVGRNDPCPCGSGKKFKKCHGQTA